MGRIVQQTLLASAVRTATIDVDFQTNGADAIKIDLDWTSDGGDDITVNILQRDAESDTYDLVLAGAALTAITHTIFQLGPTIIDETNLSANILVAPEMRFTMLVGGANNQTYSVGLTMYYNE